MKLLPLAVLALLLACPALAQDPAAAPAIPLQGMTPLGTPLGACLLIAREQNPLVEAARHRCQAAGLDTESLRRSFRDPVARASVGYYESPVDVPFGGFAPDIAADSASAQAGLEAPLAAGVYGGAGARFGRTVSAGEDDGDGFQSAGAHLRIPLLKDRGFAQNRLEEERLDREALAARAAYEVALLDAWTSVAGAYAQVLFRLADAAEVSNALVRAEQLVQDATERASLEDIAEYQVYPARYESATRAEELAGARTQIDIGMESLRLAVGASLPVALAYATPEDAFTELSEWSESLASLDTAPLLARPLADCPEVRAAQEVCNAALAQVEFETDSARDNLDIRLGAGWQSDRDSHTDRETGFGASLVFSRPLGGGGRDAAVAAATARAEAAYQDFVQACLRAEVRRTQAAAALESARGRRRLARETVEAARLVLEAENERFAIGDNSSRNVLDAQKDLSTARRRELSVSLEVITATAELFRACGVPLDAQELP